MCSDSGKCLDSGKCFWILGSVSDSGTCFWIQGNVLDSGKCLVPTSHRKNRIKVKKTTAKECKD